MAITFNDYVRECELFPYSKENYDLIKEGFELNVAAMYLESQEFMMENSDLVSSCSDGYMMEAAGEPSVAALTSKATEKKNGWLDKAKNVWNKIIKALKSFWNMIVGRFTKIKDRAKTIKEHFDVLRLDDEGKKRIAEIVNDAVKSSGIPISDNQKERFGKLPRAFLVLNENSLKNKLAAVLVNTKIELTVSKDSFPYAFSEKQLNKFFDAVSSNANIKGSTEGIKNIKKIIDDNTAYNYKNNISISKDVEEAKKFLRVIEEAENSFKSKTPNSVDPSMRAASIAVGDVSVVFSEAMKVSSDSMKLYRTVIAYQEKVMAALEAAIKSGLFEPKEKEKKD